MDIWIVSSGKSLSSKLTLPDWIHPRVESFWPTGQAGGFAGATLFWTSNELGCCKYVLEMARPATLVKRLVADIARRRYCLEPRILKCHERYFCLVFDFGVKSETRYGISDCECENVVENTSNTGSSFILYILFYLIHSVFLHLRWEHKKIRSICPIWLQ